MRVDSIEFQEAMRATPQDGLSANAIEDVMVDISRLRFEGADVMSDPVLCSTSWMEKGRIEESAFRFVFCVTSTENEYRDLVKNIMSSTSLEPHLMTVGLSNLPDLDLEEHVSLHVVGNIDHPFPSWMSFPIQPTCFVTRFTTPHIILMRKDAWHLERKILVSQTEDMPVISSRMTLSPSTVNASVWVVGEG